MKSFFNLYIVSSFIINFENIYTQTTTISSTSTTTSTRTTTTTTTTTNSKPHSITKAEIETGSERKIEIKWNPNRDTSAETRYKIVVINKNTTETFEYPGTLE